MDLYRAKQVETRGAAIGVVVDASVEGEERDRRIRLEQFDPFG